MKQGEIWLINLGPSIGAEIKKTRPAIIVNDDILGKLPLKIIVPLTDWKERAFEINIFFYHRGTETQRKKRKSFVIPTNL